jgi:hypothetical protein
MHRSNAGAQQKDRVATGIMILWFKTHGIANEVHAERTELTVNVSVSLLKVLPAEAFYFCLQGCCGGKHGL